MFLCSLFAEREKSPRQKIFFQAINSSGWLGVVSCALFFRNLFRPENDVRSESSRMGRKSLRSSLSLFCLARATRFQHLLSAHLDRAIHNSKRRLPTARRVLAFNEKLIPKVNFTPKKKVQIEAISDFGIVNEIKNRLG